MFHKSSQTSPRLLTPDDPDVPAAFSVIDHDDPYEGCDAVREKFADPQTRLVVWRNPPYFGTPYPETAEEGLALKDVVSALSLRSAQSFRLKTRLHNGWRSFFDPAYDYLETGLREHFATIAQNADFDHQACDHWHSDTLNLVETLDECFSIHQIKLATHFQAAAQYDLRGAHMPGYMRSDQLRAVRMIAGDSLRFYSEEDVTRRAYYKGLWTVNLKSDAQAWAVKPWDIAFISQNTVCETPRDVSAHGHERRRVMEVFDLRSRDEMVASAQRPTIRPLLRPLLRRIFDGPDEF